MDEIEALEIWFLVDVDGPIVRGKSEFAVEAVGAGVEFWEGKLEHFGRSVVHFGGFADAFGDSVTEFVDQFPDGGRALRSALEADFDESWFLFEEVVRVFVSGSVATSGPSGVALGDEKEARFAVKRGEIGGLVSFSCPVGKDSRA